MTSTNAAAGPTSKSGRSSNRHRVVIIGSGFGGLFAAKQLKGAPVDVTIVAKTSHHLFQPLLYQVATGVLSEGEIAPATREVLHRHKNTRVILGDVDRIDLAARTVHSQSPIGETVTPYDSLIVAAGAGQSYFGNDRLAQFAPGMKSIDDALELRGRIFGSFEMAELLEDPELVEEWLTFVVVGAGATGVEMAGQIAELAHRTLKRDFRQIDPSAARVVLLDAVPTMLGSYSERLQDKARAQLEKIGVDVELGFKVVDMDVSGVEVVDTEGNHKRIPSRTKVWAAGVQASPLGRQIAEQAGAEVDRAGRVKVLPNTSIPGHPEVFLVGDLMSIEGMPGVAQVAMQSGRHAAKEIVNGLAGKPTGKPFHYFDKGNLATVSRFHAVAQIWKLEFSGFLAWLIWLAVHIIYLIGFKNRITTLLHWTVTFIGRDRSERTATEQQVFARNAMAELAHRKAEEAQSTAEKAQPEAEKAGSTA